MEVSHSSLRGTGIRPLCDVLLRILGEWERTSTYFRGMGHFHYVTYFYVLRGNGTTTLCEALLSFKGERDTSIVWHTSTYYRGMSEALLSFKGKWDTSVMGHSTTYFEINIDWLDGVLRRIGNYSAILRRNKHWKWLRVVICITFENSPRSSVNNGNLRIAGLNLVPVLLFTFLCRILYMHFVSISHFLKYCMVVIRFWNHFILGNIARCPISP